MRCLLLILSLLCPPLFAGDNWPEYRGPGGDAHSDSTGLPTHWSETRNVAWKTPIPGRGWSTPVIFDNQIWLTTAAPDGRELWAICVQKDTGKIAVALKLRDVAHPEHVNPLNSYASPSPVIQAGRVWLHFGTYGTFCVDTQHFKLLWSRTDLNLDHMEGPGSTPVLVGDLLILTLDGTDVQHLVALDQSTGKTVWDAPRSRVLTHVTPNFRKTFSTPRLLEINGLRQLISNGPQCLYSYDPASGKELWQLPYLGFSNVTRPNYGHGLLFINTGYMRPQLWAIRPEGKGLLGDKAVVWKYTKNVPAKSGELLVDDLIYLVHDSGVITCLEAKTGAEVYKLRLPGEYSASPLYAEGRIYVGNQEGLMTVFKPGRNYEPIAANQLEDGFMASPAVSGSALYLRTADALYRIENPKK